MKTQFDRYFLPASILVGAVLISGTWIYLDNQSRLPQGGAAQNNVAELEAAVLPAQGLTLPVNWGDLGKKLIDAGVIDQTKFETLYADRGGLTDADQQWLAGQTAKPLTIDYQNSGLWLNLLWALGLGNKNAILESGPMSDPQYGGAENFASTGGWTVAKGNVMDHFSQHEFIKLTLEQQDLVARVSQNIYRPCCNNPTDFPDCNHGMAMLGLLELMASQGVSESQMYKVALQVNAYWFPETYLTIAQFLKSTGRAWQTVNPQEMLGASYSSGSGYRKILAQVTPPETSRGGGGCGL